MVEQFQNALAIWEVPATDVVLEVTESAVMEDPSLSAIVLGQLRDHGFGISIDDFGIGYSSFAYLKRFPATELKIDQEFVHDIGIHAQLPTPTIATRMVLIWSTPLWWCRGVARQSVCRGARCRRRSG